MTPEEYAQTMKLAVGLLDSQRERSQQTKEHLLGVSDIGGCPQYAVLMIRQTPFSDAPDTTKALIGTSLHSLYARRGTTSALMLGH